MKIKLLTPTSQNFFSKITGVRSENVPMLDGAWTAIPLNHNVVDEAGTDLGHGGRVHEHLLQPLRQHRDGELVGEKGRGHH